MHVYATKFNRNKIDSLQAGSHVTELFFPKASTLSSSFDILPETV